MAASLGLIGCGGGEGADGSSPSAVAGVAEEHGAEHSDATIGSIFEPPFQVPIEGPIVYEEGEEQPLVATFPEAVPEARPSIDDLPAEDPLLGKPVVINGQIVPFDEVRRQICLGPLGMSEITDARTKVFIEEEKVRRAESGAPLEGTVVGSEEVEAYLKDVEENIKRDYPEGNVGIEDLFRQLASHDPREKLRFQMEFGRLFLPDDPTQFPPITLEAILKNQGGQGVIDHYKQSFEETKISGPRSKDAGEQQFDQAIMQQILAHLVDIASVSADPAPGVLYRVNGIDILVADIWSCIQDRVTPSDVLAAKQWIVNTMLLQQALTAAGAWLSDEEAYIAYHAHSDPYKESIFSMERVAMMVKQFPSVERYTFYRRLLDSLYRMRKPSPEELQAFAAARTNKIVGQVSVDVDLLLCAAWDFQNGRWKENGWVEAENRMKDVLKLLVEEQRPWDELVERYSEVYEPPLPVSQQGLEDPNRAPKGRYRNVQRNALIGAISEHDYGMFLTGTSVTDFVFFEQEVGTLGQPIRGPLGWYLPRLIRRTKPPERIPMDETTLKDLILDDYLTTELSRYVQELIKQNTVYGLEI